MGKFILESKKVKFNKILIISICYSSLLLLVGLLMFFLPELTNKLIGQIIGVLFVLRSTTSIYKYFKRDGAKIYSFNMVFSIILFILGLITLLSPYSVTEFITVCLGLYLIIIGSSKIAYGFWLKTGNDKSWLITIVIGITLIIFGLLLFNNPFASFTLTKLVGFFLIVSSVLELTDLILLKKRSDEIVKIFW